MFKLKFVFGIIDSGGSMDSKMTTLIEKLDLSEECKSVFESAKLDRIVGSKDKTNYCFYISIDTNLNINSLQDYIKLLKNQYDKVWIEWK